MIWTVAQLAAADQDHAWAVEKCDGALGVIDASLAGPAGRLGRSRLHAALTAHLFAKPGLNRRSLCTLLAESLLRLHETGAAGVEFPAANGTPGPVEHGRVSSVPGVDAATPGTCPPAERGVPWTG